MVSLTRLDGATVLLHAAHIVSVESIPNTLLGLYGGQKLMVRESAQDVCEKVRAWCQSLCSCHHRTQFTLPAEPPSS